MIKKFFLMTLGVAIFFMNQATAAKLDYYRDLLIKNSYTIKYENITPAPRVTNRDKVEIYGKSRALTEESDYLLNKPKTGLITSQGQDKYEEVGDADFKICRLSKSGEDFFFTKYKKGDGWEYFGTRKNHVRANEKNYLAEIVEGKSYGDADMSRLLNIMLPNNSKSLEQGNSQPAGTGQLKNGMVYEDYKNVRDGVTEIVRYYFKDNLLVKISSASYYQDDTGKIEGRRCIIKIQEFTGNAQTEFLNLPAGVKDETKRQ